MSPHEFGDHFDRKIPGTFVRYCAAIDRLAARWPAPPRWYEPTWNYLVPFGVRPGDRHGIFCSKMWICNWRVTPPFISGHFW